MTSLNSKKNMPSVLKPALIIALLFLATANAATVAVLEITLADDEEIDFTIDETKFLSDELRRQATVFLPKDYSVLTREKIISLAEKAENLNTVIDIGKAIKSDYVTQGLISKLGGIFTLTVELYETSSGKLLGYFTKESPDLKGFLNVIRENTPNLFATIMPKEPPAIAKPETAIDTQSVAATIPTNIPAEPKKSKTPFWIAIGLDALGTTALGLGIYSNAKSNDYYDEYKNLRKENLPDNEGQYPEKQAAFDAKYKKMQNAQKVRNIFYATGGALLLGGVVVHIWF